MLHYDFPVLYTGTEVASHLLPGVFFSVCVCAREHDHFALWMFRSMPLYFSLYESSRFFSDFEDAFYPFSKRNNTSVTFFTLT